MAATRFAMHAAHRTDTDQPSLYGDSYQPIAPKTQIGYRVARMKTLWRSVIDLAGSGRSSGLPGCQPDPERDEHGAGHRVEDAACWRAA
jgi:hypothetical protein